MAADLDCPICMDSLLDTPEIQNGQTILHLVPNIPLPLANAKVCSTQCGHLFHTYCLFRFLAARRACHSRCCPCCKTLVVPANVHPVYLNCAPNQQEIEARAARKRSLQSSTDDNNLIQKFIKTVDDSGVIRLRSSNMTELPTAENWEFFARLKRIRDSIPEASTATVVAATVEPPSPILTPPPPTVLTPAERHRNQYNARQKAKAKAIRMEECQPMWSSFLAETFGGAFAFQK